jgi:hypothetical protein
LAGFGAVILGGVDPLKPCNMGLSVPVAASRVGAPP